MGKRRATILSISVIVFIFLRTAICYADTAASYQSITAEGIIRQSSFAGSQTNVSKVPFTTAWPKLSEVSEINTAFSILGGLLILLVIDICWMRWDNR